MLSKPGRLLRAGCSEEGEAIGLPLDGGPMASTARGSSDDLAGLLGDPEVSVPAREDLMSGESGLLPGPDRLPSLPPPLDRAAGRALVVRVLPLVLVPPPRNGRSTLCAVAST
jgi:hypothetical protein